jgi:hypothetical protein
VQDLLAGGEAVITTIRITDCGCYFEYEPDLSKEYLARWILCGKPECWRVQAAVERVVLEEDIKATELRLESLKARLAKT